MAKDPAQRYPSCLDFAQALGAAMTESAVYRQLTQAALPRPMPGPPTPYQPTPYQPMPYQPMPAAPAQPRWPAIAVPLILAVLLVGAVAFATTQVLRPDPRPSTAAPQWQPYVDYAKQFTVWLTSLSPQSAASDVQRIIDGSTGEFHDDFANKRSEFESVVVGSNVSTQGSVTSAGLEAVKGTTAQVLVAAATKVTNNSGASQDPRSWRLILWVEKIGNTYKVSKVEFVT